MPSTDSSKKRKQPDHHQSTPTSSSQQQPARKRKKSAENQEQQPAVAASDAAAADDSVRRLFRALQWKREHRPDKERFVRPYLHAMCVAVADDGSHQQQLQQQPQQQQPQQVTLTIKQQKFTSEGFASTVWDGSIVVAKYLEKLGPGWLRGRRCLDLSAGCGLVGIVAAKLHAESVTLTDLAGNLPLLQQNCTANGVADVTAVVEHRWGEDVSALQPPFDVIFACDVMYVLELVPPLLQSLLSLSGSSTTILVAHGRNRPAEPQFISAAAQHFSIEQVPGMELDDVFQCSDVDVLRLRRLAL